jgi:peptidyl-prolyl cis-trans isomerase C
MNAPQSPAGGCGSGSCQCASAAAQASAPVPSINGISLHAPGEQPDQLTLQELAYAELLRQQAVKAGLLPRSKGLTAPVLNEAERKVLEDMLDAAVTSPQPTEEECQRYYTANQAQFVVGQAVHVRHILFAVTPGVNVHALTVRAEKALIELLGKNVGPDRFVSLAAELSNCPTNTRGGDLGWLQPHDCAPELANELFHLTPSGLGLGVHPRLIHTRFGFHIIQVLGSRKGKQAPYEEVRERIAAQLTLQSRAKALHQYMSLLVGQALVEGVHLERADSPLVQ